MFSLNLCLVDYLPHSEKSSAQGTPAQHPSTKISSGPESQKTLSLGKPYINTDTADSDRERFHLYNLECVWCYCVIVLILAEHSGGEALTSQIYNVILIGDSCVGKTSYMKRVQTGKFSLDHPASVGKIPTFIPLNHQPAC